MADFESLVPAIQRLEAQVSTSQLKTDTNQKRMEAKIQAYSEKFEVLRENMRTCQE